MSDDAKVSAPYREPAKPRRNRAKCAKCGDIVESLHRHHFVQCSCGAIAVDGGHAYWKRVGDLAAFLDVPDDEESTR